MEISETEGVRRTDSLDAQSSEVRNIASLSASSAMDKGRVKVDPCRSGRGGVDGYETLTDAPDEAAFAGDEAGECDPFAEGSPRP